jgi:hypothetical protein
MWCGLVPYSDKSSPKLTVFGSEAKAFGSEAKAFGPEAKAFGADAIAFETGGRTAYDKEAA